MPQTDKHLIHALIAATGVSSVVTQLYAIREILSQFSGNEFVISLIIFVWLILGGLGTLAALTANRFRGPVFLPLDPLLHPHTGPVTRQSAAGPPVPGPYLPQRQKQTPALAGNPPSGGRARTSAAPARAVPEHRTQWFAKHASSPLTFFALLGGLGIVYLLLSSREELVLFSSGFLTMGSEILIIFFV